MRGLKGDFDAERWTLSVEANLPRPSRTGVHAPPHRLPELLST